MSASADVVERFAAAYRAARDARLTRETRRAREILSKLPALAAELRRDFGISRLGYFGSLRSGRLGDESDVDLYVDRVRRGGYFSAVDRASTVLGVQVDLVEVETASGSLRATIVAEGVSVDG
jgi:predicted nucleotidyltransferase